MFRRRRPLLRGAAVGAAGYAVGKRMADGDAEQEYVEEGGDPGSVSNASIEELTKLAELKEEGVLTDAEFQAQKERILG